MKADLTEHLIALKEKGTVLSVKWDAGGDETLLHFFEGEEKVPDSRDGMYGQLRDFLIEKFDLPNGGEYFNEGGGIFALENQKIAFTFSELAYSRYEEDGCEIITAEEDLTIQAPEGMTSFLAAQHLTEAYFHGETNYFRAEVVNTTFRVITPTFQSVPPDGFTEGLREKFERIAQSTFDTPIQHGEIRYAGKLYAHEVIFEEVSLTKYATDKDHREKKIYLFA